MTGRSQSMLNYIANRDHRVMHRVNSWRAPRWIRLWMICATRGGDGWLWYALGLFLLFYGEAERFRAVAAMSVAGAIGTVIFLWVKRYTGRRRPCAFEPHCWAKLLPPDQFSFPSGHSITAFSCAVCIGLFYPSLFVGLLFCAFSIAISRILLGMHFLSDVLTGSALGAVLGYSAFLLYR